MKEVDVVLNTKILFDGNFCSIDCFGLVCIPSDTASEGVSFECNYFRFKYGQSMRTDLVKKYINRIPHAIRCDECKEKYGV